MAEARGAVVLGMSRSGTSAVAAMFVRAGYHPGAAGELMPASDANPGGYWEHERLWRLNDEILVRLGGSWLDPPAPAAQLEAARWATPALGAAVGHIQDGAAGRPIVIKDPRICVMTAIWHPIIDGHLHPVLVVRDPLEVADSLHRRDRTPPPLGLAVWELHVRLLLAYLHGRRVTVAPYEQLLAGVEAAASIVASTCTHLDRAAVRQVRPELAPRALEREYRRHEASDRDHRAELTGSQADLWAYLGSVEAGSQVLDVPEGLRRPTSHARTGAAGESERVRVVERAGELGAARAHVAELEAAQVEGRRDLADQRQRTAELERALGEERGHAAARERMLFHERAQSAAVAAELERVGNELVGAHAALSDTWGSASWRITSPLRSAKRGASRLRATPATFAASSRSARRRRRALPPCEIHVPISPTPSFITRVRYLAASVRCFGGALREAPVIVTVGGDQPVDLERRHPWSAALGVEWRWVPEPAWRKHSSAATALQRFCYEIDAPAALMLDSDTLFAAPIDELLPAVTDSETVCGVPAHVSPFTEAERGQALWGEVFREAGLPEPEMICEHSGWEAMESDPARRFCPPYFNFGMVLVSRDLAARLGETIVSEMESVQRVLDTVFRCQLALTLAIARSGARWWELPLRFNFPNDLSFMTRNGTELEDVRIVHYLREDELSRTSDFHSPDAVSAFLDRGRMHVVNERFRQSLRVVHDHVLAVG